MVVFSAKVRLECIYDGTPLYNYDKTLMCNIVIRFPLKIDDKFRIIKTNKTVLPWQTVGRPEGNLKIQEKKTRNNLCLLLN